MNETRMLVRWLPSVTVLLVATALHLGCSTATVPVGDDPIDDVDNSLVDTDGDGCSDFDELNFDGFCNNDPAVPGDGDGGNEPPPGPTPTATPTPTAVGVANGSAASATIGAAGGSVSTPDGKIALTIPAGALALDTEISIQPITNLAHGKVGDAYRLAPEGQTFLVPVSLTFGYDDADLEGTAVEALGAAFQTADGHWQWAGDATVDTMAKTVSIGTSHFSDWSAVKGFQIHPASKTVKVNEIVGLQVVGCYDPVVGEDELQPLGYGCGVDEDDLTPLLPSVSEWSVNGRLGGGTFGTVSGNGSSASYTAPAFEPTPNIVAVSARVEVRGKGKTLVVSNITVVGDDSWTGTASFSDSMNSASAQITWTKLVSDNNIVTYLATGTGTIAGQDGIYCSFPATSGTVASGAGILVVDYNNTPPTYNGLAALGTWIVTMTCETSSGITTEQVPYGLPVFGGTQGSDGVEAAGSVLLTPALPPLPEEMTIEGSDTDGLDGIFQWTFTRNP